MNSTKKLNPDTDYLSSLIGVLPDKPGVYQYFDKEGKILYIGKAKNIKKRVSSYFHRKTHEHNRLRVMISKIADIKHLVVENESDALLLENNLIKKYQPRYNVNLKDDKTFPWICIKNENFPRVFLTRKIIRDGSVYYGPYTSALMVRTLIELIRQLYHLRTCTHHLSPENIKKGKFKVCLEYHLGNCLGPCEGKQSKEDYDQQILHIHSILKGNIREVTGHFKKEMKALAEKHKFEQAQQIKEKLDLLERFRAKSTIVNPGIHNVEVYSFMQEEDTAVINFLNVAGGAIIQAYTLEIRKRLDESREELLAMGIAEIKNRIRHSTKEIIVPFKPDVELEQIKYAVPQRGDKKKLLDLSMRNASYYLLEKRKQRDNPGRGGAVERILDTVQKDLRLKKKPVHIECFDNSNTQGSDPVAACVVFKNLKPVKKEYRHYHIKTVQGPDDFASMEEVVYRRYNRRLDEGGAIPDLVVVDGGKGQLNAAVKSLEKLGIRGKAAIIGIAKRLEEIYFPGDPVPLYIDKNSETLKVLQNIRNEAHRFGIGFHRNVRTRRMLHSELDRIEGIGQKSIDKLLEKYKTVQEIKKAPHAEINNLLGKTRGDQLIRGLKRAE